MSASTLPKLESPVNVVLNPVQVEKKSKGFAPCYPISSRAWF